MKEEPLMKKQALRRITDFLATGRRKILLLRVLPKDDSLVFFLINKRLLYSMASCAERSQTLYERERAKKYIKCRYFVSLYKKVLKNTQKSWMLEIEYQGAIYRWGKLPLPHLFSMWERSECIKWWQVLFENSKFRKNCQMSYYLVQSL